MSVPTATFCVFLLLLGAVVTQQQEEELDDGPSDSTKGVKRVHLVFSNHLDIGYTGAL